jgi:hypothetical protein
MFKRRRGFVTTLQLTWGLLAETTFTLSSLPA